MTAAVFDATADLPRGRISIGASAGTGKTYTLATLAARYVVEEAVPVQRLLVVTFTRAAAAELKDRLRGRLVEFAMELEAKCSDPSHKPDDPVLGAVCSTDVASRLRRAHTAVTEFDSATVTTIHGFAQQVLGTLGSSAGTDPDALLVDDADALIRQAATDVLVSEAAQWTPGLPPLGDLAESVRLAMRNPGSDLRPSDSECAEAAASEIALDRSAATMRRLVDSVVEVIRRRHTTAGTLSFDDLLVRLRDALVHPGSGASVRALLRQRYSVALIDEFQDTDPVQWDIFDSLFGLPEHDDDGFGTDLVLVGDPKQAIYAFRGANVHTYLAAVDGITAARLDTNWRSDPALLRANRTLFRGVTFGNRRIAFEEVHAPDPEPDSRFLGPSGESIEALSIRLACGGTVPHTKDGRFVTVEGARNAIYRDLAAHVRDLLGTTRIPAGGPERGTMSGESGGGVKMTALRPEHIAVLIGAHSEAPRVRDALEALGIPAVVARGASVLTSPAATQWHLLLEAVAHPRNAAKARAGAASWFIGWDATELATATDAQLAAEQERYHHWARQLEGRGVATFVGTVIHESGVTSRVLGRRDGERDATDLDHIGELLIGAAEQTTSAGALLATFEQLGTAGNGADPEADLVARRVESDAGAVQIMTTFVAKGLQFPVVCCPSLWAPSGMKVRDAVWSEGAKRSIDVAPDTAWGSEDSRNHRRAKAFEELLGTNLRLLYVALTRAKHHTALWWAPSQDAWKTGLARVLFGRDDEARIAADAFDTAQTERIDHVPPEECMSLLAPLVERSAGAIDTTVVGNPENDNTTPWSGAPEPGTAALAARHFERALDRSVDRWSFTRITAAAHGTDPGDTSAGDARSGDEPQGTTEPQPDDPAYNADPLPLGAIPGGAGFGTLVHKVLETLDFTSEDLLGAIGQSVEENLRWNPWTVERDVLVAGLAQFIRTPLGPLFDGARLADIAPVDRLDELHFDLTLGEAGHRATDASIGEVVLEHLDRGSPYRPWAETLASGPFSTVLAGHLTGSADLVVRVHGDNGPRFVVCDYKTNLLATNDGEPTASDYAPDRLPAAMAVHHYPLQALLYSVALHRYLRWRLPGYDPRIHLGGIGYLFVRGMTGPDTPTVDGVPHGLAQWEPPAEMIGALSDLLDGSEVTRS